MSSYYHQQKGVTIILFAVFLTVLLGFMGLALDGGYLLLQKTRLQNTADAAALACAINSTACGAGGSNKFPDVNLYGFDVQTTNPATCPKTTQLGCVKAVASSTWNTFFMGVLGQPTLSLTATGVAGKNKAGPACVVDETNFSTNGNNAVTLNNCSAAIGGNLSTTAKSGIVINPNSGASIILYNGHSTSCNSCSPAPIGSTGPMATPPTFAAPLIAAAAAPTYDAGTSTYTYYPGSYASPVKFDKKYKYILSNGLYSGAYVFNGGWDTNSATVTNSAGGVSVYVPGDQKLTLSGTVTLSAPTPTGCADSSAVVLSHPYKTTYYGITLNGSQDHINLTGIANLVADNLTVDGSSSALSIAGSLVTNSVTLHGNMNPSFSPNPCNNLYINSLPALVE